MSLEVGGKHTENRSLFITTGNVQLSFRTFYCQNTIATAPTVFVFTMYGVENVTGVACRKKEAVGGNVLW